jgi:hypothetical protein
MVDPGVPEGVPGLDDTGLSHEWGDSDYARRDSA